MKKILVVLLVLAVAGGVFAQSNWSFAGTVEVGTRINFDPLKPDPAGTGKLVDVLNGDDEKVAYVNGIGYNWWDVPRMKFVMTYAGAGFVTELQMNTRHDNEFFVSFARPNFKAKGGIWGFEDILWQGNGGQNAATGPFSGNTGLKENDSIKRLWGEYYLLDGMITLEVAYKSEELTFWASDTTAAIGNKLGALAMPWIYVSQNWVGNFYMNHGFFDDATTFAHPDGHTYFRTDVAFSGFNFGLLIPNVFGDGANATSGMGRPQNGGNEFVADALKKSIFGAKINLYPIEFAAQFKFEDYGVYFGGKFFLGPVSIGASFMGILSPADGSNADRRMKVGGNVAYDAGAMGAGVKASMDRWTGDKNYSSSYTQVIALQPYFFFKIIPSHLGFKLDAGFYFEKNVVDKTDVTETYWAVQPQLFWNFNGTGANTGYSWGSAAGCGTHMMARYRMVSATANFLDVVFSFSL
jgi:hypothetical protein